MEGQDGGKRSAWMTHVKKTMRAHKGMKLMQVLKLAKKTYKKTRRGGGLSPSPLDGGRRRGGQDPEEKPEVTEEKPEIVETTPISTEGGRKKRKSRGSRKTRSRKH